jgi:hypothetical protein
MAILGMAAIACAGCAIESGETGSDRDQVGEGRKSLGMYAEKFAISDTGHVGPTSFHVAQGGSVNAEVSSAWISKPTFTCKGGMGMLLLKKRSPPIDTLRGKTFHAGATRQNVVWSTLVAGDYDLTLDAMNDNPGCILSGDITITIKP